MTTKFEYIEKHMVKMDGKLIGEIRKSSGDNLYRYHPKGSKHSGDGFVSLHSCKMSIEA